MSKVLDVAWREFRHTVMTKAFFVAVVILPLVMWGMAIVLPAVMHAPPKPLAGEVAVVDTTGVLFDSVVTEFEPERLREELEQKRAEFTKLLDDAAIPVGLRSVIEEELEDLDERIVPDIEFREVTDPAELDAIKEAVRDGELIAAVVFEPAVLSATPADNRFELLVPGGTTRKHVDLLKGGLRRAVVRARVPADTDLETIQALLDRPAAVTTKLTEDGEAEENELVEVMVPLAFMILLWMSTMVTGNYLLTSTIEEKSNKVIEVLLSAVSPMQLMTGKILGQGMVGALMMGLYTGVGVSAAVRFDLAHLVPPEKLAYLALYFIMAYFMVAAVMAAIGSAVNELREAQSLLGPVSFILMLPFFAWFFISDNPNSVFATVLSFIPPVTPFTMILRVTAVEPVPTWQIIATLFVGFGGVLAAVWGSARIFRVGVLMYGKPPTPAELWKWVQRA